MFVFLVSDRTGGKPPPVSSKTI